MKQLLDNPWEQICEEYSSGKLVKGVVLKVLEKGIIFNLDKDVEGIVPIKQMNKDEKQNIIDNYKEGDSCEVIVQEVDEDAKKIILMFNDLDNDLKDNDKTGKAMTSKDVVAVEVSSKDVVDATSSEDVVDKASNKDVVDEASSEDVANEASSKAVVDETSSEDVVDEASNKDVVDETSSEDVADEASDEDVTEKNI